jgi:hypothetical protein
MRKSGSSTGSVRGVGTGRRTSQRARSRRSPPARCGSDCSHRIPLATVAQSGQLASSRGVLARPRRGGKQPSWRRCSSRGLHARVRIGGDPVSDTQVPAARSELIRGSGAVDRSRQARAEGRKGRNPATGEAINVAAKPASVDRADASAGEGQGGAAERAESPPTTGPAQGLRHRST